MIGWIDGREAADDPLLVSASMAYGVAAFEGILCTEDLERPGVCHALRLDDHLRRLERSTRALGWELPAPLPEIEKTVVEVARRAGRGCCYLRPLVFCRDAFTEPERVLGASATVSLAVHAVPFAFAAFLLQMSRPRRAAIASAPHPGGPPRLRGAKLSGAYLPLLTALAEARDRRCDEAILLDGDGRVVEASTANLFAVRGGTLVTPSAPFALPGVTRRCVLELAPPLGLRCEERALPVDELLAADEIFLTSTARGVVGLESVDGRWRPRGRRWTEALRQAYLRVLTGEDADRAAWRTIIPEAAPLSPGAPGR
jgi:branched-chain amino acid aminotransferase